MHTAESKPRRFPRRTASVLLLAIAGAGALLFSARPPSAVEVDGEITALAWRHGTTRSYQLQVRSTIDLDVAATPRRVVHHLAGRLHLRVLAPEAGAVRLAMQLDQVRYAFDGQRDAAREQHCTAPFVAVFAPSGRMRRLDFPDGVPASTRHELTETLRTFQVVVPESSQRRWTMIEAHASGRYRAVYELDQDAPPVVIGKRKTIYLGDAVGHSGAGGTSVRVHSARARFTLDRDAWLDAAEVREQLEFSRAAGTLARLHLHATLRVDATATPAPPRTAADILTRRFTPQPAAAIADRPPAPRPLTDADRARCAAAIDEFVAGGGKDMALLRWIAALLRQLPELAAGIPAIVDRAGLPDSVAAGLIHALELAGHAVAQTALIELFDDAERGVIHRLRALVATGGVAHPTRATLQRLWAVADRAAGPHPTLGHTALLALGQLGSTLRRNDAALHRGDAADTTDPADPADPADTADTAGTADYAQLTQRLVDHAATAADPAHRSVALRALGNTGDTALAAPVRSYLDDASPTVRAAAARALGAFDSPRSLEHLTGRLHTERDGEVKAALVRNAARLSHHSVETFTLCDALVQQEADPAARGALARYLVDHLDEYPDARPTLNRLIRRETDTNTLSYVAGRLLRSR